MALLIIFATLPVPLGVIRAVLRDRNTRTSRNAENGPYSIVSTEETPMSDITELNHMNGAAAAVS